MSETRRGSSITGDPENMLSKAPEIDVCFHRGSAFWEYGRTVS